MDFADSPEHAAFRTEFRHWLETNLPSEICVDDAADQRVASDRETLEKRIAWQKTMHAAGWVGISWPEEYGGRGASFMQQVIFDEEYFRARAPVLPTASALNLLGPTLIHWGTEEQKKRHLPRILSADELWCQGYSEPDAGGDLASLRTRAVDTGEHFVVNGQKVWTSGAHFADWCFLLVRTDPDAPKHQGISYLLVDMKTPGITVRPLVLLNGHRHFNEVFFEDVAVPKENLVGPLNQGWKVAITTLMFERSGAGGRDHAAQIARLAELAILKLFGSELALRIADFSSTLLGPYATVNAPTEAVPDAARWHHRVLGARQYTIAGGTSEIQRNIIGERVLGLPKG